MGHFQKILVPIDFSDCSRAALEHAAFLAQKIQGTIDLVHIWDVPAFIAPEAMVGAAGTTQTLAQLAQDQAGVTMKEFAEEARKNGLPIGNATTEQGDAARTIVELAEREAYDLIAMGTHGRSGFAHLLLGSVAEKVVRHSKVPVLTIRESAKAG